MKIQKSFQNEDGPALWLVPTPIGNLHEVSQRTIEVLQQADVIACEDTRNSGQLLKALGIQKPLISHHEHNSARSTPGIVRLLEEGKKVAVISDAGYPLISDPGAGLVEAAIEHDFPVISISGPNAALDALVASGLPVRHFLYYGFLDTRSGRRKKELESLKEFPWTLVFYEAPHRIEETLQDFLEVFGNRRMVLARELTKLHEEYLRGTTQEILEQCRGLRGEMVLVVEGCSEKPSASWQEVLDKAAELARAGMKPKQAAAEASSNTPFSKNEVYQAMMRLRRDSLENEN